jgi:hypothetical protein
MHKLVDGTTFRGAHIGSRNDAQPAVTFLQLFQGRLEETEAGPPYECTEKIYGVGGLDLTSEFGRQVRFVFAVGEKSRVTQFGCGSPKSATLKSVWSVERMEFVRTRDNAVTLVELSQDAVGKVYTILGSSCGQGTTDYFRYMAGKDIWSVVVVDTCEMRL